MKPRVLIVDDSSSLANAFRRGLRASFDCTVATTETEALAALTEHDWDAIVCDMLMPALSGPQLYRWLKGARPLLVTRIVFVTGLDPKVARDTLGEISAPVLIKPFTVEDLRAAIQQLLG